MGWLQNLPRNIFSNWHVKSISLALAIVIVLVNTISNVEERTITVPLEARLPLNHLPANEIPSDIRVILRGENDDIVAISDEDVRAIVDLTLYQQAGTHNVPVKIERRNDTLNIENLVIKSDPPVLSVELEEKIEKRVEVVADIRGILASGYQLASTIVIPKAVTIAGPRSMLDKIFWISTDPVNISDITSSSTTEAELIIPGSYMELPNEETVTVVATVEEIAIIRSIEGVEIEIINLRQRLAIDYNLQSSFVIASAFPSQVNKLRNEDIRLVMNTEQIRVPGQYILALTPQLSQQYQQTIEIIDYGPKTLPVLVAGQ